MSKKGIISGILIASLVCIGIKIINNNNKKIDINNNTVLEKEKESKKRVNIGELHSEILRLIASGSDPVCDIKPDDAEKELSQRIGNEVEIDKKPADHKKLPIEILKIISNSSATIAGIQPKKAINELTIRYLSLDALDLNSAILLEALQNKKEKENIKKWADNEDAEAIEAFMKEEADKDPSSVANLAYGLKHLDDKHEEAMTYMERYANHAHGDAYDNKDEKESNKILIEAVKNLK